MKEISQRNLKRIDLSSCVPLNTPLVIYIEPSGLCNLQCSFCMHGDSNNNFPKSTMSFELWKKCIDDISNFEQPIKLLRVCGNGDPLTHKNIVDMLAYAKKSKYIEKIELVSNGTLFNDKILSNISKYIDRFIISIEGLSDEDYYQVTKKKINFDNFVNDIKELYKNKYDCKIHLKIHNEAVKTQDRKDLFFNIFSNYCDEIFIENLVPMWPELDIGIKKSHARYGGDIINKKVCPQIFKGFQIQAEGDVVACCVDWQRKNFIGDINKESVIDVWNGLLLKQLQYEHLCGNKNKIEVCASCTMNDTNEIDNLDANMNKIKQKYYNKYSLFSKLG